MLIVLPVFKFFVQIRLLTIKEVLVVAREHVRFLRHVPRSSGNLGLEGVLPVLLLVKATLAVHAFLYSVRSVFVEPLDDVGGPALLF